MASMSNAFLVLFNFPVSPLYIYIYISIYLYIYLFIYLSYTLFLSFFIFISLFLSLSLFSSWSQCMCLYLWCEIRYINLSLWAYLRNIIYRLTLHKDLLCKNLYFAKTSQCFAPQFTRQMERNPPNCNICVHFFILFKYKQIYQKHEVSHSHYFYP